MSVLLTILLLNRIITIHKAAATMEVVATTMHPLTAVAVATVVAVVIVEGVATEVVITDHNIISIRNNSGLFHLGLHRGNHGPRHHVRTQIRQIGNISPMLANKGFLDQSLNRLI
jgi:hypothetical protein